MRPKGRRARAAARPSLSVPEVLAWADAHHARKGRWPGLASGFVRDAPLGVSWRQVDNALRLGLRGLPAGGSSLARLLARERGVRNGLGLPQLSAAQVLAWADEHRARTGSWPNAASGPVADAPGETWAAVAAALQAGHRGLQGGSSLARLLARERGARNPKGLPPLAVPRVLRWARAHERRTGLWPDRASGPVPEAPGETWAAVAAALQGGWRGLPAGLTLARLRDGQAAPRPPVRQRLSEARVLAWADDHRARTGDWPRARGGPVAGAPGETWRGVDDALRGGLRALPDGASLAGLLARERGARTRAGLPRLRAWRIVAWARAHRRRTGRWPTAGSGPVAQAPGETWKGL